jgi:hypothetical protein
MTQLRLPNGLQDAPPFSPFATSIAMLRVPLLLSADLLIAVVVAVSEQRMIRIGDRRVSVYCDGEATRFPRWSSFRLVEGTAKDREAV